MYVVGAIEILAGVVVALKPRYGGHVVAAWLGAIIVRLLTYSGFYDIALRDFGFMLGALTLARLAAAYDPPLPSAGAEQHEPLRPASAARSPACAAAPHPPAAHVAPQQEPSRGDLDVVAVQGVGLLILHHACDLADQVLVVAGTA